MARQQEKQKEISPPNRCATKKALGCGSMRTIWRQRLVVVVPTILARKTRKNTHNTHKFMSSGIINYFHIS
jgi:hypothetical protein